jgi:hypothetical protein
VFTEITHPVLPGIEVKEPPKEPPKEKPKTNKKTVKVALPKSK